MYVCLNICLYLKLHTDLHICLWDYCHHHANFHTSLKCAVSLYRNLQSDTWPGSDGRLPGVQTAIVMSLNDRSRWSCPRVEQFVGTAEFHWSTNNIFHHIVVNISGNKRIIIAWSNCLEVVNTFAHMLTPDILPPDIHINISSAITAVYCQLPSRCCLVIFDDVGWIIVIFETINI